MNICRQCGAAWPDIETGGRCAACRELSVIQARQSGNDQASHLPIWTWIVGVVALLAFAWGLNGSSGQNTSSPVPEDYGGGVHWDRSYSDTTCMDWEGLMTDAQQRTFTGDIMLDAGERAGAKEPLPSVEVLEAMMKVVSDGCSQGIGTSPRQTIILAYFATPGLGG